MLQHLVSRDLRRISRYPEAVVADAIREVVIFAAPAPELVRKAVHAFHLLARQRAHAAKYVFVRKAAKKLRQKNQIVS